MPRDNKGRFAKACEDNIKINFSVPSIKKVILWGLILLILMPWISIITRFNLPKKILELFDELINAQVEDPIKEEKMENPKKNGLFY